MIVGAATDSGRVREHNEDSYIVMYGQPGLPNFFAVADGMGGHSSGETASKLAVDHVVEYIKANPAVFMNKTNIPENLIIMMKNTNRLVIECSETTDKWRGMGTTLTISVLSDNYLHIGHVGDSRVYLLNGNLLKKVTVDHSYIEELIRTGKITREQAQSHPSRNVITKAIGGVDSDIEADTYSCEIIEGTYIIMCTDGLTNELNEIDIVQAINTTETPQKACEMLINKANSNGGRDNITVIIIRC